MFRKAPDRVMVKAKVRDVHEMSIESPPLELVAELLLARRAGVRLVGDVLRGVVDVPHVPAPLRHDLAFPSFRKGTADLFPDPNGCQASLGQTLFLFLVVST